MSDYKVCVWSREICSIFVVKEEKQFYKNIRYHSGYKLFIYKHRRHYKSIQKCAKKAIT